jgi:DNA modification methylase
VVRECVRVLKPTGSLWVNLGDKFSTGNSGHREQKAKIRSRAVDELPPKTLMGLPWRFALACMDELGLILRRDIIWRKINGLPESVTDRCCTSHEYLFHFARQPRYYAAADEIREPARYLGGMSWAQRRARGDRPRQGEQTDSFCGGMAAHSQGRMPGSVWDVATEPLISPDVSPLDGLRMPRHHAAFPTALVRRVVLGWSPTGGLVVDPFGGTGTTALVASALGRVGVSVDASHDYARLARWRTTDPGQRAKALGVAKPPVQVQGQADLFGGAA